MYPSVASKINYFCNHRVIGNTPYIALNIHDARELFFRASWGKDLFTIGVRMTKTQQVLVIHVLVMSQWLQHVC